MQKIKKADIVKKIGTELKIQGKSERTVRNYVYYNLDFLKFIGKQPKQVTTDDIKSYLAFRLTDKGNDPATVALARSALRFFYDEVLKRKITADIKTPKKQRKLPEVLTKQEVRDLIKNTDNLRDKLLIEFMYSSGLRVAECVGLKKKDLNIPDKTGLIRRGKGGKDRFFILSDKLIQDLNDYIPAVDKTKADYLFPGRKSNSSISVRHAQKIVHKAASEAGIKKKVYCHLLRHAFATHLLESGTDIRLIQELLAHSNLQTTQFYTTVSTKQLKKVRSPLDVL
ncbi:tyrosine-type recombinase/integrase [Candidatus Woesearchaeota archaeon]|nr:tyrosine-type recombinase/integrase [Candidatus Woesearchaeota archaeon]